MTLLSQCVDAAFTTTNRCCLRWSTVPLAAFLALFCAGTLSAQNFDWDNGDTNNNFWTSPDNWSTNTVPTSTNSTQARLFGGPKSQPIDADHIADINGANIDLTNANQNYTIGFYNGSEGGFRIMDSMGTGSIKTDIFHVQQGGRAAGGTGYEVYVPIEATKEIRTRYRLGTVKFFETLDAPELDLGRGDVYMYADVDATTEFKILNDDNTTKAYLRQHPTTNAVPTLTTPLVLIDDLSSNSAFYAGGIVDADTVTILNGKYYAEIDGSLGDTSTNVTVGGDTGKLYVQSSQTDAGSVNVEDSGYALFDEAGINLQNLSLNNSFAAGTTGAEISSGSSVIVNGTLSGAGAWGGAGTLHVAGTVSPGNSIETITGANLNIMDGGTYDFEIENPDGGQGVGWDYIDVDSLTFDGDWTLNVIDFGLTRDIDPTEEFIIASFVSTDFDPANAMVDVPMDWFVGDDPLFLDGNGNLVLTNISNVQAVPEPASIAIWSIFGLGLAAFGYYRSRRKK